MWNIRMRASKKTGRQGEKSPADNHCSPELHISGAEGIFGEKEIAKIVRGYIDRALSHPKGRPDTIVVCAEELTRRPLQIHSLPVTTLSSRSSVQTGSLTQNLLRTCGLSEKAIRAALDVINSPDSMRGAALVLSVSGRRVEPDKKRGIRASRLGITRSAQGVLSRKLGKYGINNATVREAIILASKVAACKEVIAELCVSDDPGYTTGYIASGNFGYIRIPHMKKKGEKKGGRIFFVGEYADVDAVREFMEKTPVIIGNVSPCFGSRTIDEIIDNTDQ